MTSEMIVDVDGVLLNWYDSFLRYARQRGFNEVGDNTSTLDRVYQRLGISEQEASKLIRDFNQSAAVGFLPPLFDAVSGLRHLHGKYGITFHVLSSFGTDEYATQLRTMNLLNRFGSIFQSFKYIGQYETKDKALERFAGSGMYFMEDTPHQLERCEELGLRPALMAHPYNVGAKYPRYHSWSHFINHEFGP